ncbi:response regulator [Patescibacteria group bacterium]|nr:response regulator [Patescibacteria group bacterium]
MNTERKPQILVVEPNDDLLNYFRQSLQGNYNVIAMNRPEKAKTALQNGYNFDLITTALIMPGESGIDLIRFARGIESYKDVPILCITGLILDKELTKKVTESGCSKIIYKPIIGQKLKLKINDFINL